MCILEIVCIITLDWLNNFLTFLSIAEFLLKFEQKVYILINLPMNLQMNFPNQSNVKTLPKFAIEIP